MNIVINILLAKNVVLDIGPMHYMVLSFIVFAAGISTILTKRNAIAILIGIELMINAAAINFVASWNFYYSQKLDGLAFGIFIVVIAAAEAAIGLAIILNYYNNFASVDVEKAEQLKG